MVGRFNFIDSDSYRFRISNPIRKKKKNIFTFILSLIAKHLIIADYNELKTFKN